MDQGKLKYRDFALSSPVEEILEEDFWLFEGYNSGMFALSKGPVKFSAATSLYLRKGRGKFMLSLKEIEVEAPAMISIREGEIMQPLECSDDLNVAFCVMSKRFVDTLYGMIADVSALSVMHRTTVLNIPSEMSYAYDMFYETLKSINEDPDNKTRLRALLHTVLAFYYRFATKIYEQVDNRKIDAASRLTESFLYLVQQNFREERFLDFYAERLGITRKHLSRVVKQKTGLSPVDWIDRNVILEAKVLLKSSNMTIQQISDTLNFSSQSFFGKHFKHHTGHTPGEFRNM